MQNDALVAPQQREVSRLPYQKASELLRAYWDGVKFTLHYHGKEREVTDMQAGIQCVWVCAGWMLPVHIRADGTSKDGPHIWLTAPAPLEQPAAREGA